MILRVCDKIPYNLPSCRPEEEFIIEEHVSKLISPNNIQYELPVLNLIEIRVVVSELKHAGFHADKPDLSTGTELLTTCILRYFTRHFSKCPFYTLYASH
jgi:hypothetical protein